MGLWLRGEFLLGVYSIGISEPELGGNYFRYPVDTYDRYVDLR